MKSKRQEEILNLIDKKVILTQDELQSELEKAGYKTTQSTISRDIKDLRIIKAQDYKGIYRYVSPFNTNLDTALTSSDHYFDIFKKSVLSVDYAQNIVVIKCYSGMAQSACVAFDVLFKENILGSLAGEDTIIIVTRSEHDSEQLYKNIRELL